MRLVKQLTVDNQTYAVSQETIRLTLNDNGAADIVVMANRPLKGRVVFALGYEGQRIHRYFDGFVEQSTTINAEQQRLRCREWSALLNLPCALALRHPTLPQVCVAIGQKTGLRFVVPDQDYSQTRAPHYHTLGNGRLAVTQLASVFDVPNAIWQQNGDGTVFYGAYADSYWQDKPVTLASKDMRQVNNNRFTMAVMPALRPGAKVNDRIVTEIEFSQTHMVVTCETSLNGS